MEHLSHVAFRIDRTGLHGPQVRILVDGVEALNRAGQQIGCTPASLLLSTALDPQVPTRRIAFYGCGCGTFGCYNVAGLVTEADGVVRWSDFMTVTGEYGGPLPDEGPDPAVGEGAEFARRLPLPDLAFDARQYAAAVAAARAAWCASSDAGSGE